MEIANSLKTLKEVARQIIDDAASLGDLESLRVRYLGKKGEITAQLKQIGSLSHDERRSFGQQVNTVKVEIQQCWRTRDGPID